MPRNTADTQTHTHTQTEHFSTEWGCWLRSLRSLSQQGRMYASPFLRVTGFARYALMCLSSSACHAPTGLTPILPCPAGLYLRLRRFDKVPRVLGLNAPVCTWFAPFPVFFWRCFNMLRHLMTLKTIIFLRARATFLIVGLNAPLCT